MKMKTKNRSGLSKEGVLVPDGVYYGKLSGYKAQFLFADSIYSFEVENGVRGINIPVEITIKNLPDRIEIWVSTQ